MDADYYIHNKCAALACSAPKAGAPAQAPGHARQNRCPLAADAVAPACRAAQSVSEGAAG
eukprot:scaffold32272_cov90-Isochrysis_galbana.AAC.1